MQINPAPHPVAPGSFPSATLTAGGKIVSNYFDGLPVSTTHKILFFVIMMSYFFEQMDNWNFGFIAPQLVQSWGLSMTDIGRINFFYFIAMTLGGLAGGFISDVIGRRKTFLGAILLFSIGSVVNGLTSDLTIFTIARAATGFGVFCLMVCSQAYIAEISPAENRGKWQGLIAAVGFSAVPVIGALCRMIIPLGAEAWRWIFYFGGLGLAGFLIGLKYLKESPRWLVAHKRVAEAETVIEQISGVKVDLSEAATKVELKESAWKTIVGMFSFKYLKRTLVLFSFVALTTPAGFVVTVWTPMMINKKGFSIEDSLTASFILMIGVPVGCFVASLISDKGGRKIPMCAAAVAGAVFSVIFTQVSSLFALTAIGFILIACFMCMSFISFSYIAESYPTRMRNTATGIHNATGRFATSFMQTLVPVIFAGSGFVGVYNTVAAMMLAPIVIVLIWGIRTGGKSLEEIS
jgi:putative MFS transporter